SGPVGTSLTLGAVPRVAEIVLQSSEAESGIHAQGAPSTAFSLIVPTRWVLAAATSMIQRSRPLAGARACATNAACLESGAQIASTAFNLAGRPAMAFGAAASTDCNCSEMS